MIEAKELRIGNIVDYNGVECIVTGAMHKRILVAGMSVHSSEDNFSGIPLTEEWLLKFGFEWKSKAQIDITKSEGDLIFYFFKEFESKRFLIYNKHESHLALEIDIPKYVHQLQNLYFALTGSELSVSSHLVQP